jgi:hypothetical protein
MAATRIDCDIHPAVGGTRFGASLAAEDAR